MSMEKKLMGMLTVGSLSHAPSSSPYSSSFAAAATTAARRTIASRAELREARRNPRTPPRSARRRTDAPGRDRRSRRLRNRARRRRRRGARTKTRAREAPSGGDARQFPPYRSETRWAQPRCEEFPFRRMTRTREPSGRPRRRRRAPSSVIGRRARPRRHARRPLASRACGSVRPRGASATIRRKFKDVCVPPRHRDESSCHSLEPGRPNQESTSKRSPR